MKNLTLLIPAKREVESLPIFLNEIKNLNVKKLVVLEKEDWITKKAINNFLDVDILVQNKNGYGNALTEGIRYCKTDYLCIINADGSMNPSYLKKMLRLCEKKDFIFTSRYEDETSGSEDDNFITYFGNKFFSTLGNILFGLNISDILYTYILGKTKSFQKLNLQYSNFCICVEIPIMAKRNNLKYEVIPSFERKRIAGKKKVSAFKDGSLILFAMIKFFLSKTVNKIYE